MKTPLIFSLLFIIGLTGCSRNSNGNSNEIIKIPIGFSKPIYPPDNTPSADKIILGKKLFFDKNLSAKKNISCASCHKPEIAFSDNIPFSVGSHGKVGFRNSPSIVNVAFKSLFHKDGGVRTLEMQVLAPLTDSLEMDGNLVTILKELNQDSEYVSLFNLAFGSPPTVFGITRAIANYERSLIYGNSAFDQFQNGDTNALSASQKSGLALFNSDSLNCTSCHSGALLTDFKYHNVGLAHQFADSGRARITYAHADLGKFETPSLRNIALTAPYMHNGSISTLDSLIIFFEQGGGNHPNKSTNIKPFHLNAQERMDLKNFLESLTDEAFLQNIGR